MGGSPSTFLIALGEIISIFIYIFGFHWKIWMILMFGLHFRLLYFCILCQNSQGQNGGQTSRSSKFFNEIQKIHIKIERISPRAIKKVEWDPLKSWPLFWQFWTLDDCNVNCWADGKNPIIDFELWALGLSSPMKKN